MPHLVKPFRGNVGTVLPEDGLVEAELDELVLVAQLLECGIFLKSTTKIQNPFDKCDTLPVPFIYYQVKKINHGD